VAYDDAGNFQNSASATLAAGPLNDLDRATLPGYSSGSTKRLLLTPASGGTTINGLSATNCDDGHTILIVNMSTTDLLIFTHLAGGSLSANQFSNMNAGSVSIAALGAAPCTYLRGAINKWQFI
jgi:hypothetical protein